MTNNCLVTKLKSVVDNSDLLKIGEYLIPAIRVTNGVVEGTDVTVRAKTGSIVNESGETISEAVSNQVFSTVGECDLIVSNVYNVIRSENILMPTSFFTVTPQLVVYKRQLGLPAKISELQKISPTIETWVLYDNKSIFGNIDDSEYSFLRGLVNLHDFAFGGEGTSGYAIQMSNLGSYLPDNLWQLTLNYFVVTGSIEDLVSGLRQNRTTGELTFSLANNNTMNISFDSNVLQDGMYDISWTASTITCSLRA